MQDFMGDRTALVDLICKDWSDFWMRLVIANERTGEKTKKSEGEREGDRKDRREGR